MRIVYIAYIPYFKTFKVKYYALSKAVFKQDFLFYMVPLYKIIPWHKNHKAYFEVKKFQFVCIALDINASIFLIALIKYELLK